MIFYKKDGLFYQSKVVPKIQHSDEFKRLGKEALGLIYLEKDSEFFNLQGNRIASNLDEIKTMFGVENFGGNYFFKFGSYEKTLYVWGPTRFKVININEYGMKFPTITEIFARYQEAQFQAANDLDLIKMFSGLKAYSDLADLIKRRGKDITYAEMAAISNEFAKFWFVLLPIIDFKEERKLTLTDAYSEGINPTIAEDNNLVLKLLKRK